MALPSAAQAVAINPPTRQAVLKDLLPAIKAARARFQRLSRSGWSAEHKALEDTVNTLSRVAVALGASQFDVTSDH